MSTINFGGLASGIDTEGIIDALMQVARQPINLAESKKSSLNSKLSAYGTLSSQLSQLRTAAMALDSESDFRALSANSADESKLTAVASSGAVPGSYALRVNTLASIERTYSDTFATKDTTGLFGSGLLSIQVGSDPAVDVTIDASDTLETVAQKINDSGVAASASIVYDGADYRLVVMGDQTGAAHGITFTEGGTLTLGVSNLANEAQAATDASVTLDGIDFSSATNQLTEMIPGLTIDLHATTGADTVALSVAVDADAMAAKVQTFVDKYNQMANYLRGQFSYSGSARTDTLMGDSTARGIRSRLQGIIASEVPGLSGAYTTLGSVGVSSDKDGSLTFDSSKFKTALASDPSGVLELFAHDDGDDNLDEDGIAVRMTNALDAILQDPDGVLETRRDGLQDSIRAADNRIDELTRRLDGYEAMLRKQFTAMEQAMAEFQNTSAYLSQS